MFNYKLIIIKHFYECILVYSSSDATKKTPQLLLTVTAVVLCYLCLFKILDSSIEHADIEITVNVLIKTVTDSF